MTCSPETRRSGSYWPSQRSPPKRLCENRNPAQRPATAKTIVHKDIGISSLEMAARITMPAKAQMPDSISRGPKCRSAPQFGQRSAVERIFSRQTGQIVTALDAGSIIGRYSPHVHPRRSALPQPCAIAHQPGPPPGHGDTDQDCSQKCVRPSGSGVLRAGLQALA